MVKTEFKIIISLILVLFVSLGAYAYTKANSDMGNTYVAPCFKNPNGLKYCSANGGRYFYDEGTNKFWIALAHVNENMYITDVVYAEYNPKTKSVNWNTTAGFSVSITNLSILSAAVAGDTSGLINVNTVKTVEQINAEKKKAEEAAIKALAAKEQAEKLKKQQEKEKLQQALTVAKNNGDLPTCKKLYLKYSLNPLNAFSLENREPYKNIEGTEKTYCLLKDGTATTLQFEEKEDLNYHIKYRGLKLMDFTGKTKYYPWDN